MATTQIPATGLTDLVRFAGASGDYNPLHHDREFARAAGYSDLVVMGTLGAAWLWNLAEREIPLLTESLALLEARFVAPVLAGQELVAVTNAGGSSGPAAELKDCDGATVTTLRASVAAEGLVASSGPVPPSGLSAPYEWPVEEGASRTFDEACHQCPRVRGHEVVNPLFLGTAHHWAPAGNPVYALGFSFSNTVAANIRVTVSDRLPRVGDRLFARHGVVQRYEKPSRRFERIEFTEFGVFVSASPPTAEAPDLLAGYVVTFASLGGRAPTPVASGRDGG